MNKVFILIFFIINIIFQSAQDANAEMHYSSAPDWFVEKVIDRTYDDWYGIYKEDDPESKVGYGNFTTQLKGNKYCYIYEFVTFSKISDTQQFSEEIIMESCFKSSAPFDMISETYTLIDIDGIFSWELLLNDKIITENMYDNGQLLESGSYEIYEIYRLNHAFIYEYVVSDQETKIGDIYIIPSLSESNEDFAFRILDIEEKFISGKYIRHYLIENDIYDDNLDKQYDVYDEFKLLQFKTPYLANTNTIGKIEPRETAMDINSSIDILQDSRIQINESKYLNEHIVKKTNPGGYNSDKIYKLRYKILGYYNTDFTQDTSNQSVFLENGLNYLYLGKNERFSLKDIDYDDYIAALKYMAENPKLNALAGEIIQNSNYFNNDILKLMDWVYNNIEYRNELYGETDPYKILENGYGDCTEISDIFIALLKSMGIPARRVRGWAGGFYTGGDMSFGGHMWVEADVNGLWQAFDPTWGIKLNDSLNHIAENSKKNDLNIYKPKFNLQLDRVYTINEIHKFD